MTEDQLGMKGRIQVLLTEYASLRAEITQRGSLKIQMSAVGGTAVIAIFGYMLAHHAGYAGILLVFFAGILSIIGVAHNEWEVRAIKIHLRLLEGRINKIAGQELLT